MAEKTTFRSVCEDMGVCCPHGYLAIEDIKARGRSQVLTGGMIGSKFGFDPDSGTAILRRWKRGDYTCEKMRNCIMDKAGLVSDDIPALSPDEKAFRALKGPVHQVYLTKREPERVGEPIRGIVVSQSQYPWFCFTLSLPPDAPQLPLIRLGDALWVDNVVWGTVVDIDGPLITLLVNGEKHRCRNNQLIFRRGRS